MSNSSLSSRATSEEIADRIVKVDHAGEHGAVNIYRGQILMCRWRAPRLVPELQSFMAHEERHRDIFANELVRRGRARCWSYHLCGLGGLTLGLVTGLCGPGAVSATTYAVERVVLKHLEEQMKVLGPLDAAAFAAVAAIVTEEKAHYDSALGQSSAESVWFKVLAPIVSLSTEVVIWLGMKL